MAQNIFKGLGIALITPFTPEGNVDTKALKRLVEYQIQNGADFLCILATTGETPCLSAEEKQLIKELVVDVNHGRLPILMGCGGNNTRAVVEELKTADWRGIDGVLSVCPYYNKPSQEGIYRHFCAIAEASPVPVLLYNVPGRTGVNITPETALRIHTANPDKVCGIKEASGNVPQIEHVLRQSPSDFLVISGDDGIACQLMEAGASGLISVASNAFPADFHKIIYNKDSALQARYAQMVHLLFAEGNPSGIKTILAALGIISNCLRLPLVPNSEAVQTEIRCALRSLTDE